MMNQKKQILSALALIITLGSMFFVGYRLGKASVPTAPSFNVINSSEGAPDSVNFAPFWAAWSLLDSKFAGTTTVDQEKIWGAIKGLTKTFNDPYTVFMPPEESQSFNDQISGSFQGIGMEVGMKDNIITVVAPLKDTPAELAGVKSGDKVLKVDGTSTENLPIDSAIKLIRGKAGTTVTLTLGRNGKPAFDVPIVRAVIQVPVVGTKLKETVDANGKTTSSGTGLRKDGIYVIQLYSFSSNSADLFKIAIEDFIKKKANKLIIDVRGNPGGYLDAAVDIASWFLPEGAIVVKEEHKDNTEKDYRSRGYKVFGKDLKIIMLIDGGSASASEILAGALGDHGVAKTVGTKSFGKGSVQELFKITPDTSLKITIAKWLTPNGISISHQGITPDYVVPFTEEDIKAKRDVQMDKAVELLLKP